MKSRKIIKLTMASLFAALPLCAQVYTTGDVYAPQSTSIPYYLSETVTVGITSTGVLHIDSGGTAYMATLSVGSSATAVGTVSVDGGRLEVEAYGKIGDMGSGALVINSGTASFIELNAGVNAGSTGSLQISNGVLTTSGATNLGVSGSAALAISGGAVTFSNITLGANIGSSGVITMSNGSLKGQTTSIGVNGTGALYITGGNATFASLKLGAGYSGSGTIRLTGGTLTSVGGSNTMGAGGAGFFVVDGGTATMTSVFVGGESAGTLDLKSGSFYGIGGFMVGNHASGATGTLTVSSNMDNVNLENVFFGQAADVTLRVDGNDATYGGAFVHVNELFMNAQGSYVIDLSDYTGSLGVPLAILTAQQVDQPATEISWIIKGYAADKSEGKVLYSFWEDGTLYVGMTIPEQAASAGLLGLLALAFVARRRK